MRGIFVFGFLGFAQVALAAGAPTCVDNRGQFLDVNNTQVLQWKVSTPNQYQNRAHVAGPVIQIFPDHSGHEHFAIALGSDASDGLEVIYNQDFGSVPPPRIGDQVEACGDYITSTAQSGPYPESPEDAIIHWVHASPNNNHPSGFLMVNGVVYGQDIQGAGPKPHHGGGGDGL